MKKVLFIAIFFSQLLWAKDIGLPILVPVSFDSVVENLISSSGATPNEFSDFLYDFSYQIFGKIWFFPIAHGNAAVNYQGNFHSIANNKLDVAIKQVKISEPGVTSCAFCSAQAQVVEITFITQAYQNKNEVKSAYTVIVNLIEDTDSGYTKVFVDSPSHMFNEEDPNANTYNIKQTEGSIKIYFRGDWTYSGNRVGIQGIYELEIKYNSSLDMSLYFSPDSYAIRNKLAFFYDGKLSN